MSIHYGKANISHLDIIFGWLAESFVQEFWDNTQGHKDDILNFVNGRKEPSNYCDGKYFYWIASCDSHPFAMLMTIQETAEDHVDDIKLNHLSKTGNTYGIDYMIGDKNYFGKGYGAKTLSEFIDFFRREFDVSADTFIIDPASDNPRAKHVYMKAGFEHIADFIMGGDVSGAGKSHQLLIRRFSPNVQLVPAAPSDYPIIQNMAQFYVYDASRKCGFSISENGLYEPNDYKSYFEEATKKAFLIRVSGEISGFALINQKGLVVKTHWKIDQFFILAKFQGMGMGQQIAHQIFDMHSGIFEVSVIPQNNTALLFWSKVISLYTNRIYACETKTISHDEHQPQRIVFTFDTNNKVNNAKDDLSIRLSQVADISCMVEMSYQKRRLYEKAQPQFWKYAGDVAEISQARWFEELLAHDDHIMLTAVRYQKIVGFIIGKLISAPEVYNPGGLTLMIDDFCVDDDSEWHSIGSKLIQEIKTISKTKGAAQILVVCGAHDHPKRRFLMNQNLSIASEWFVGGIA